MKLPLSTSRLACAHARSNYIQNRLHTDFYESIPTSEHPVNTRGRFEFPVFTCAAIDYQKITKILPIGKDEEQQSTTFQTAEETCLPQFKTFLAQAADNLCELQKAGSQKIGEQLMALRKPVTSRADALTAARASLVGGGGGGAGGVGGGLGGGGSAAASAGLGPYYAAPPMPPVGGAPADSDADSDIECLGEVSNVKAYIELSDSD